MWRLRHSAWMLAPLLSLGALAWVGFVYVAARTLKPTYVALAGFFLVAGGLAGFWPDDANNTQGGLLIFVWAAAIVTAFIINPGYLRWRAMRGLPPQSPTEAPPAQPWESPRARRTRSAARVTRPARSSVRAAAGSPRSAEHCRCGLASRVSARRGSCVIDAWCRGRS